MLASLFLFDLKPVALFPEQRKGPGVASFLSNWSAEMIDDSQGKFSKDLSLFSLIDTGFLILTLVCELDSATLFSYESKDVTKDGFILLP